MEDRSEIASNGSSDLSIGVKSLSNLVVAGSSQNWLQSILRGECCEGRDTDYSFGGQESFKD